MTCVVTSLWVVHKNALCRWVFCKISILFCIVACHFARCDGDFCLDGMTAQTLFIKKHEGMTIIITENVFCIRNNCFFVVS